MSFLKFIKSLFLGTKKEDKLEEKAKNEVYPPLDNLSAATLEAPKQKVAITVEKVKPLQESKPAKEVKPKAEKEATPTEEVKSAEPTVKDIKSKSKKVEKKAEVEQAPKQSKKK